MTPTSTTLRWLAMLAALTIGLALPAAGAAGSDPFKGSWSAIDFDGSLLMVTFSGTGPTRTVTLFDDRATCLGGDPSTSTGVGTISGSTISGTYADAGCGVFGFTYTYDAGTNTLSGDELTWYRGSRGPDAFSGVWYAIDGDGSAMRLSLDGSGLTRDVSFKDDGASACGDVVDGEGIDWTGNGTGTIGSTPGFGRYIEIDLVGGCTGAPHEPIDTQTFEYLVANNQLFGPSGDYAVYWSRK